MSTTAASARRARNFALCVVLVATTSVASAQFFRRIFGGGQIAVSETARTARELGTRSTGTPMWEIPPGFESDVFTFARLRFDKYDSSNASGGWTTDLPDADLNLSYRLQQLTATQVDPNGRLLRSNDPELAKYPFLFASAPGGMVLGEAEVLGLRKYLLNGGFFLVDDFWGETEWRNFASVMRQVLPGREFEEMSLDHPIYHGIFKLNAKVQVPRIGIGLASRQNGITWEKEYDGGREVHHRGIADDKGRLMVLALHNTDTADGWEREGEDPWYFNTYAEKYSFPLGINIIFYTMTH